MPFTGQICARGLWDESVPGIKFDENGFSNYYRIQEKLTAAFPRGEIGKQRWERIVEDVKRMGKGKKYDCIVGVSGGVDSSYLLHLIKKVYGLKPLAVNLDNGWNSEIAVNNIKKVTKKLNIDLETYVVDYEEMKNILKSYMRASLPWIDGPTDRAIKATMYNIARKEGIKYIFRGNDFRSEGKQPREWTYTDSRQMRFILRKFGAFHKLHSFPDLTLFNLVYSGAVLKIKDIRPYYFLEYDKLKAKAFLEKEYDWNYYGGHHYENLFTKFAMSYWLPKKFGIDKRKINLSEQVVSGTISRESAIQQINSAAENDDNLNKLKTYVLKKLEIDEKEFEQMLQSPNKFFNDYPSYMPLLLSSTRYILPLIKFIYPIKPMAFYEIEERKSTD
jgi:N-acetyl sugar amidotransferase